MMPPLVRKLDRLIPRGKIKETAARVGCSDVTIYNWLRKGTDPRLSLFEAALNACGYKLSIVPMEKNNG
jgi:DNA-binding phage protein